MASHVDLTAIMTALGGRQAMQDVLGVGASAISNYVARGSVPTHVRSKLYNALTARGYQVRLDDLSILSKEFNVGFCLVTKRITKRLEHDVIIEIHRQSDDLPMILLYQTDTSLIHIKRKDEETTKLIDLQSKLFLKYMN